MDTTALPAEILPEQECWVLLASAEVGRLAVSITDHPDIFPVNFIVHDGAIVFRTAEGTKLAASVLGVAVAFEVDGYEPAAGRAWSVVAKGAAVEIETMDEMWDALDLPLFPWHATPKNRYVRIVPDVLTGRRFTVRDEVRRAHAPGPAG